MKRAKLASTAVQIYYVIVKRWQSILTIYTLYNYYPISDTFNFCFYIQNYSDYISYLLCIVPGLHRDDLSGSPRCLCHLWGNPPFVGVVAHQHCLPDHHRSPRRVHLHEN